LLVCPNLEDVIQDDYMLLQKHFDVKVALFTSTRTILKFIFTLLKGVIWSDITFSWFADIHAFLAVLFSKMLGKKSIVVIGGYEVANVPEINYGLFCHPISAHMVKFILKYADKILTVDEGLKKDAIKNAGTSEDKIQIVPTGCDAKKFKFNGVKDDLVITVSHGYNWKKVRLKGLDTFVESAKFLPEIKFLVIGIQGEALKKLKSIATSNVDFINPLPQDELIPYYQRAKVYCQLSMREGLPSALREAMLCECVPVGTSRQGITTAIGDTGFYVPYGDPRATAEAIKKALKSDKGKIARKRIINMFPLKRREKELIGIIKEVLK